MLGETIVSLKLPSPLCVPSGTSVRQVIDTVQQRETGAVLVCEGKRLAGIMTERDVLMKVLARDVSYHDPVDKFMTANPATLTADRTLGEAIAMMTQEGFRNGPIGDAAGEAQSPLRVRGVKPHSAATSLHTVLTPAPPHAPD